MSNKECKKIKRKRKISSNIVVVSSNGSSIIISILHHSLLRSSTFIGKITFEMYSCVQLQCSLAILWLQLSISFYRVRYA